MEDAGVCISSTTFPVVFKHGFYSRKSVPAYPVFSQSISLWEHSSCLQGHNTTNRQNSPHKQQDMTPQRSRLKSCSFFLSLLTIHTADGTKTHCKVSVTTHQARQHGNPNVNKFMLNPKNVLHRSHQ